MTMSKPVSYRKFALLVFVGVGVSLAATAQPVGMAHADELKQQLTESREKLKEYEWIETVAIHHKGEVKTTKRNRCSYDAEGNIQKEALDEATEQPERKRQGVIGRVVAQKKEETKDYVERAAELIKLYVPPRAESIQKAKDAGKLSTDADMATKRAKIALKDLHLEGDSLTFDMDLENKMILGVNVATYLDDPEDSVQMRLDFQKLPDGIQYPARTELDVAAKNIKIIVTNTDYRKVEV